MLPAHFILSPAIDLGCPFIGSSLSPPRKLKLLSIRICEWKVKRKERLEKKDQTIRLGWEVRVGEGRTPWIISLSLSYSKFSFISLSFVIFLNISLFCVHLSVLMLMSVSMYISLSQSSIFSSPFATLHICLWREKKGLPINNQLQFLLPSNSFAKTKNKKKFLKIPFRLMRTNFKLFSIALNCLIYYLIKVFLKTWSKFNFDSELFKVEWDDKN